VTIDKVIVNTPTTAEKLAAANDRKNRLDPVVSYLLNGISAVKTLVTVRAMGTSGLRVIQQLASALGEVEAELALAQRDITHLEQQRDAEVAILPGTPKPRKGGRRVPKH
jgi:hypothetical protein